MDVEVILKRLLVYTAVVAAIAGIYLVILRTSSGLFFQTEDEHRWLIAFLATVIVVLLAKPVKDAVQSAIDRAFYRDRYDYRRALVAFARDLNTDLDLNRLSERLVARVKETFLVDRMALMLGERRRRVRTAPGRRLRGRPAAAVDRVRDRRPAGRRPSGASRRSARRRALHRRGSRAVARRRRLLPGSVRLERRGSTRCSPSGAATPGSR